MKVLIFLYRKVLCRKLFYTLNLRIFDMCLRGIGVFNYEGYEVSGEKWFLETFLKDKEISTIVDVGANIDPYGISLPTAQVFALEPHLGTFKNLKKRMRSYPHIKCFAVGLSNKKGKATLYDISRQGTALASLQKETFGNLYGLKYVESQITLTTLDTFVKEHRIDTIDLLKIDTEGNEYNVLLGAKKTLAKKKIRIILFEFNEINAYNRIFFRDFSDLLKDFTLYKLLPDGMVPYGKYRPITHELFAFQNVVAIREE